MAISKGFSCFGVSVCSPSCSRHAPVKIGPVFPPPLRVQSLATIQTILRNLPVFLAVASAATFKSLSVAAR